MVSTSLSAQQLIPFTVNYDEKDIPIGNGYPKSPMRPPVVYIEDYTLTFVAGHPDYELTIKYFCNLCRNAGYAAVNSYRRVCHRA